MNKSIAVTGVLGRARNLSLSRFGGVSGYTGYTAVKCCVCEKNHSDRYRTIDFEPSSDLSDKNCKPLYGICPNCFMFTNEMLYRIEEMEMIKLPLYINDSNIFVKEAVKKRLASNDSQVHL